MSSISVDSTGTYTAADRVLRNIPNAISLARLLATPVLLWMVLLHRQELFKWLLLACLLSDILDGWIARAFELRSKRGASLDSLADLLVALNMVLGLFVFQREFLAVHYREVLLVVGLFAIEAIAAILRYGRISSFHTTLNRIAAYAQGFSSCRCFYGAIRDGYSSQQSFFRFYPAAKSSCCSICCRNGAVTYGEFIGYSPTKEEFRPELLACHRQSLFGRASNPCPSASPG